MEITPNVQRVLEAEAISAEELAYMLKHTAKSRVEGFNRRYFSWLFRLNEDNTSLQAMRRFDLVEEGQGDIRVFEEHDVCEGEGCRACGWVGTICRRVTNKVIPGYSPFAA